MTPQPSIVEAYIAYFNEVEGVRHAEVDGGYIVVKASCSNCRHFNTSQTENCLYPCSSGCWQWELKEAA